MIELAIDRTENCQSNGGAKSSSARENLTVKIRVVGTILAAFYDQKYSARISAR
jgi:hypothetical protein